MTQVKQVEEAIQTHAPAVRLRDPSAIAKALHRDAVKESQTELEHMFVPIGPGRTRSR